LNYLGNLKQESIFSISYESRLSIHDQLPKKNKKENLYNTDIDFVQTQINLGPSFFDEKEEKFNAVPPVEEKSFFQKYVRILIKRFSGGF